MDKVVDTIKNSDKWCQCCGAKLNIEIRENEAVSEYGTKYRYRVSKCLDCRELISTDYTLEFNKGEIERILKIEEVLYGETLF